MLVARLPAPTPRQAHACMELRHLRYAVAVADAGSMTRAAQALHVVQQALSQQIADLERELNVRLFERHARGVRPTAAGVRFVSDARDILAAADAAVARVRTPVRAPLRVGLVDYGGGTALVRGAVAAYEAGDVVTDGPLSVEPTRSSRDATSPSRAVVLDARPVVQQPDAVRTGALDVGFWCDAFRPRVADADGRGAVTLHFEPLLVDPNAGALLPADHALGRREALYARDLAALPLVAHAAAPWALAMEDELRRLRAAGWRGRIGYELPDGADVIRLVAAGAGWAHVQQSVAHDPPAGTVYRPLLDGTGTPYTLYMVTRSSDMASASPGPTHEAARFVACLKAARDRSGFSGSQTLPLHDTFV